MLGVVVYRRSAHDLQSLTVQQLLAGFLPEDLLDLTCFSLLYAPLIKVKLHMCSFAHTIKNIGEFIV